jgi:hypothetical protein
MMAPLLSTEELDKVSRTLAERAAAEGIRVAVTGSFAMNLYGSRRLTADVDVIADKELAGHQRVEVGLRGSGQVEFSGQKFRTKADLRTARADESGRIEQGRRSSP